MFSSQVVTGGGNSERRKHVHRKTHPLQMASEVFTPFEILHFVETQTRDSESLCVEGGYPMPFEQMSFWLNMLYSAILKKLA